jgi:hypothetical protein
VTVPMMSFPWGTQTRPHYSITMTFDALPQSMGVAPSGAISIEGSYKQASAVLTIDDPITGTQPPPHDASSYPTSNAYIFHGIAAVTP